MKSRTWIILLLTIIVFAAGAPFAVSAEETTGKKQFEPMDNAGGANKTDTPGAEKPDGEAPTEGKEGEKAEGEEGQKEQQPQGFGSMWQFMLIILGFFFLMMVLSGRGKRKQQKKHKEMLDSLKKGDKVVSIGGIVGNVVEAREKEIIIKISDNSRMTLARWAIRAAGEEAQEDKEKDTQEQK
jgi:preprotein translocase subunit YajC